MLTQEAIFIATIKGTSLVIKTRPLSPKSHNPAIISYHARTYLVPGTAVPTGTCGYLL